MPLISSMRLNSLDVGRSSEGELALIRRFLVVTYNDGLTAEFWPTRYRPVEKPAQLGQICLYLDDESMATYNGFASSRGSQTSDHCLIYHEEGYSPRVVASYWNEALKEAQTGAYTKQYWNGTSFALEILNSDSQGLAMLASGKISLDAPVEKPRRKPNGPHRSAQ